MKGVCSNHAFRGCPASFYLSCRGYAEGLNCWELDEKPCCPTSDPAVCKKCAVYIKYNHACVHM
ncbi:MAG: hypothetical protein ABFD49_01770 [Armatimonadota bacterium]|nr:hypothetical protein [bacterium]